MSRGDINWTQLLPLGFILLVALASWLASLRSRRVRKLLGEADQHMAKQYGPEWRQLAWSGQTRSGQPAFDAVRDQRMRDLSPAQQADARELWIRENKEWFGSYYRGHIDFLLQRLDQARGARR